MIRVGLVAFIFNLGGGLIAPALPLYARSLGADYRDLGFIGAAYGVAFAALTIPLGRASDRLGRRTLLVASAAMIIVATLCYLMSRGVPGLVVGRLLEAVSWAAFWPSLEAWVAEEFGERPAAVMGVAYGSYAAAFVAGTSAAGFAMESWGLRAPFLGYLATALVTAVLVVAMPAHAKAAEPAPLGAAGFPEAGAAGADRRGHARRQRLLAYGTGFVYVFGLGTVLSFLPAYAADRGLAAHAVGLLVGAYWGGRVLASFTLGRLSDRVGRRALLVPTVLGIAVAAALVAAPLGTIVFFLGTLALGLASGACAPSCIALIADHTAPEDRGKAMGTFESACGASFVAAGFLGGQAAYAWGAQAPYLIAAAIAAAWTPVLAMQLAGRPSGTGARSPRA